MPLHIERAYLPPAAPRPSKQMTLKLNSHFPAQSQSPQEFDRLSQLIKQCGNKKDLTEAKKAHAIVASSAYRSNWSLACQLVHMYGKCGSITSALEVFRTIKEPDLHSWNNLLSAFTQNGHLDQARRTFRQMTKRNIVSWTSMMIGLASNGYLEEAGEILQSMPEWNAVPFTAMITAYAQNKDLQRARAMFESMPEWNVVSWTAILVSYAQLGDVAEAERLFGRMPEKDEVSWNAMLAAYARNGEIAKAKKMLERMPLVTVVPWTAVLKAQAQAGFLEEAKLMFDRMPRHDELACVALVSAFGRDGHLEMASRVFDTIPVAARGMVSWTSMFAALALNGRVGEARGVFERMPERNVVAWNAMVTMLSVSGDRQRAKRCFDSIPERDAVSWNALAAAYARKEYLLQALQLLHEISVEGVQPDSVFFISIMSSCSHCGVMSKAWACFETMIVDHSVRPDRELFSCVVDMLGRAGLLVEAQELLNEMPFSPSKVTWGSLLAASKVQKNVQLGDNAADEFIKLDESASVSYMLLANLKKNSCF